MGEPAARALALRIERGRAGELELAALTAVLCAVLARRAQAAGRVEAVGQEPSGAVSWRPESPRAVHRPPHCWR
ncbi:acyl-CoA carboxylase epsilon subunit [Streptomyces sp. SID5789]|uniref:acyl-CoA carboxylase epsilon subunit n=1 Tax=Streptomyces sp. SID5789 TaxID=2690310 RepID=UPI00136B198D|nr:acyl-CoA carboxylase epsilon subunit [Streptomyces sp. SID5789]MZE67778.1 acyl-CoA carboxylase subunit epsilon [Streptomyces sp. SID5789]